MVFIATCWEKNLFSDPLVEKKSCATREKHLFYSRFPRTSNFTLTKLIFFSLVAQCYIPLLYTIFFLLGVRKMDLFALQGEIKCTLWLAIRKNYFIWWIVIFYWIKTKFNLINWNISLIIKNWSNQYFFECIVTSLHKLKNYLFCVKKSLVNLIINTFSDLIHYNYQNLYC